MCFLPNVTASRSQRDASCLHTSLFPYCLLSHPCCTKGPIRRETRTSAFFMTVFLEQGPSHKGCLMLICWINNLCMCHYPSKLRTLRKAGTWNLPGQGRAGCHSEACSDAREGSCAPGTAKQWEQRPTFLSWWNLCDRALRPPSPC